MTRNRFSRDLGSFIRKHFSSFLLVLIILFSLHACYNEPNSVGGDMIPSEDKTEILVTDTFKVSAYTYPSDSIPTGAYSTAILGCNNSDIFGKVKADFVTAFSLARTSDTFQKLPGRPMDSVFLELHLNRTWGKENSPINIRAYQINFDIFNTNTEKVYVNGLKPIESTQYSAIPVTLPCVYSGQDSVRIRFTDDFVENTLKQLPDSAFISSTVLQDKFKGLYVTSDDYNGNDGALYFFNANYKSIKIVIHHSRATVRNGSNIVVDTVFNLLSMTAPRYNLYNHDYSTANPGLKINHIYDTTLNAVNVEDSVFYIDGLGGVKGMVKFEGAEAWKKLMPIAIHKAELQLDVEDLAPFSTDSLINPIVYYYKRGYSVDYTISSVDLEKLLDYYISYDYDAKYNRVKKCFSFDVTVQLQNILRNKVKENYFFIETSDFKANYRQGIFRTGKNSKPMKLIITYSKL